MNGATNSSSSVRNKMLAWCLLWVYAAVFTHAGGVTCPSTCTCTDGIHFEVECDTDQGYFEVTALRSPSHLILTCSGPTPGCDELELLQPALPPLTMRSLELRDCAIVSSISCIPLALGIANLTSLTVRDPPPPGALQRNYVAGLDSVSELSLLSVSCVQPSLLTALPALRRFVVRGSNLTLTSRMFQDATSLEYIELSANRISELPPSTFRGLSKLRVLSLWGNRIANITADALEGLDSVESLDLSTNLLRVVDGNALAAIPNLKSVNLFGEPLEKLELNGLPKLEEIAVVDCRAELAEVAFRELTELRSLRLERCRVKVLKADALRGAFKLKTLSLAYNNLQALPVELLQDATALRWLNLSNNKIMNLEPKLYAPLAILEELVLDDNPVKGFPSEVFSGLASARRISCARCGAQFVGNAAFPASLQRLGLTSNQLAGVPAMPALVELDLSANKVSTMPDDWRLVMTHLRFLNLSHNLITAITETELDFLSTDLEIDLRYNNITSIELNSEQANPTEEDARRLLWLDHNPFSCDCRLLGLVQALKTQLTRSAIKLEAEHATCASPFALASVPLQQVPLSSLQCGLPPSVCPALCSCEVHPATSQLDVICADWPLAAPLPNPADYNLNATSLRIDLVPRIIQDLPPHVRDLNLSSLNLTEAPILAPIATTLLTMDLSKNSLKRPPLELLESARQLKVFLADNPFRCSCPHADDIRALQEMEWRIVDAELLTCEGGGVIQRLDVARLCAARAVWVAAALGACVAAVALAAVALALQRLGLPLRVWLHARGWLPAWLEPDEEDGDRQYDVFVSFSHGDTGLVTEKLVPGLEAAGLCVCVHYRDWAPGEMIPDQIIKSVNAARRTVVVLSRAFLASEWARAEFRVAHVRALREGRARVIAVLAEDAKVLLADARMDAELRGYLASNTYLEVADAWFWDKLRYALRRRRVALPPLPVKF